MATEVPLTYSQNARPVGFPVTFRLSGDRLTVDTTRKVQEVRLGAVEQVRLTYEPRSFASGAFKTVLTLRDGKRVSLTSMTWKSLVEAQSQSAAYGAFTRALLQAVAAANPGARFIAGKSAPVWGVIVLLAALSLLAVAFFAWRALQTEARGAALFGAVIAGVGIWQLEPMVRLNRPRPFAPDAPPRALVP